MKFEVILSNIDIVIKSSYKKRAALIKKLMGTRIVDALLFMPSYILEKKYICPVTSFYKNQIVITRFTPIAISETGFGAKKLCKILGFSGETTLELVFFNSKNAYYKNYIKIGQEVIISGKLTESTRNILQIVHPEKIKDTSSVSTFENVYPLTSGITSYVVQSVINDAVSYLKQTQIEEWIPDSILKEYKWKSFSESITYIHHPTHIHDIDLQNIYRQRLCFDECLSEQIAKKMNNNKTNGGDIIRNEKVLFNKLIDILPFKLTDEQFKVVAEIEQDLVSGRSMSRLLQGDVGSGKTIVAILTALIIVESGYQVAFLAPTEILARQHYDSLNRFLKEIDVSVDILTANEKGKKREEVKTNISNGNTKVVVGTHAIISEGVQFSKLGLVVIDEQHRFGVNQRLQLINKGESPHVLSMTATPIPRTLILSLYGDISVSSIKQKPVGRLEIITKAIPISRISEIVKSIEKTIQKGEKIYWVCPLIEESENLDYTCVTNRYTFLRDFFQDDVVMMHGKMKPEERDEVFSKFRNGTAHILVSTTIIEVGVDIKDASVIIIENAEKFGLSQLHQLRGRVGRSDIQSYCILLYDNKISAQQKQRIQVIRDSTDGFYIADKDLILRGCGEVIGTKQSGFKAYKTFDVNDEENQEIIYKIMKDATECAKNIDMLKCEPLLKIFMPENFKNITQSF